MDFRKAALLLSLITGEHALGHIDAADKKGFDSSINMSNMSEDIKSKTRAIGIKSNGGVHRANVKVKPTSDEAAFIAGGGFAAQDRLRELMDTPEGRMASALYKAGYLAGVPKVLGADTKGDFATMQKHKGKKAKRVMQAAVGLSALSDFAKSKGIGLGKNNDLSAFTFENGTPGLMFTHKF